MLFNYPTIYFIQIVLIIGNGLDIFIFYVSQGFLKVNGYKDSHYNIFSDFIVLQYTSPARSNFLYFFDDI